MSILEGTRAWARRVKRDGVTLWFARRHPRTPLAAKALGLFVVAYALSPIDLIPDFIPVLGYLDDVILLPALIWLTVKMLPDVVLMECRQMAQAWIAAQGTKPQVRWGAALIFVIWLVSGLAIWEWLRPLSSAN